jgi:hypothetical protein
LPSLLDGLFVVPVSALAASSFTFRLLSQKNKAGTAIPMNIDTVKTIGSGTGN